MFLCEKNIEIWRKSPKKICRNDDFRHFRHFQPGKKIFSKIGLSRILGIANMRLCAKNQVIIRLRSIDSAFDWFD